MHSQFYTGIVENRDDPLKLGRCQVRVFGVHSESLIDVPTASLPWAIPLMPITSASMSGIGEAPTGILNGSMVIVYFQDGESKQMPVMMGTIPGIPQTQDSGLRGGAIDEVVNLGGPTTTQNNTTTTSNVVTTGDGSTLVTSDGTPVITSPDTVNVLGESAAYHLEKTSLARCTTLLKQFESFKAAPYRDSLAKGLPTIGYGTTIYPDGKKV